MPGPHWWYRVRGAFRHSGVAVAALAGLVLIVGAIFSPYGRANGGTPRLNKTSAGPYLVSAWTQPDPPRVGRVDVSVAVMHPLTGEPALDVEGHLSAKSIPVRETTTSATLERGGGGNLFLYHANLELPAAGRWEVTVSLEGPEGAGQVAFELDVRPPTPAAWWLIIGAVVAGAVWWLWVRTTRRQRSG